MTAGARDDAATTTCTTHSAEQSRALGERLAAALRPGDVLGLVGPLGAGKTQLVKGIARGLGVDERLVSSPTFVLHNEYEASPRIHHFDAYRLDGPAELTALGFEEICDSGGLVVVEWADRVREIMPAGAAWITIEPIPPDERRVSISGGAGLANRLASAVAAAPPIRSCHDPGAG